LPKRVSAGPPRARYWLTGMTAGNIKLERIAASVAAANSYKAVADEWLIKVRTPF